MEVAEVITRKGLSKCQRNHVHFYEFDRRGNLTSGQSVRFGSEVGIVVSARQCMGDGIVPYRSSNNAILTEGINGVVDFQYFRFLIRLRRDPKRKRTAIWRQQGWAIGEMGESEDDVPHAMCTQTNMGDETMYTAKSSGSRGHHTHSPDTGMHTTLGDEVIAG